MFNYLTYPFILGSDVSGVVISSQSPLFKPGDRVLSHAFGSDHRSKSSAEGAFQSFVLARANLTAKIPDSVSFERACVLPLCLSTAATALFLPRFLGLDYPTVHAESKRGQTVVVWGASTSVGSNAVQLARGAGYEVIATASPKNWEYVRGLGAGEVFDYRSGTAVSDIAKALEGKACAGAVAIGHDSMGPCLDIVGAAKGVEGKRKFVAQVSGSVSIEEAANYRFGPLGLIGILGKLVWAGLMMAVKSRLNGVQYEFVWGGDLVDSDLAEKVYNNYLPAALETGEFRPAPGPQVVGKSLQEIQEAFEACKKGVSASKVVVTL